MLLALTELICLSDRVVSEYRPPQSLRRISGGQPEQGKADSAGFSEPDLPDLPEVAPGRCAWAQHVTLCRYCPLDIPVATLRGFSICDDHTDHPYAPRIVTQPSNNAVQSRWHRDSFGTLVVKENPSRLGAFVHNLRLPGQQGKRCGGLKEAESAGGVVDDGRKLLGRPWRGLSVGMNIRSSK